MKKKDFDKTEYLGESITPEGIVRWKRTRCLMRKQLVPDITVAVILNVISSVLLIAMSFMLDNFINGIQQSGNIEIGSLIILIVLILMIALSAFSTNYFVWELGVKGQKIVSAYVYKTALTNDKFLSKVKSGDIVSIASNDSEAIGERLGSRSVVTIFGFVEAAIVLSMIFYFSWIVGVAVVVFYPLYFLVNVLISKKIEKKGYENAKDWAHLSHVRLKGIQGWLELAMLKKRSYYTKSFSSSFDKATKSYLAKNRWVALQQTTWVIANYYLPVISVIVCTLPFLYGSETDTSLIIIVYMLTGFIIHPLDALSQVLQMYSEDKALYKRMSDLLFINPEEGNEGEDVGEIKDIDIQIDDYSYGGDELLLKNCKLHAERGDVVSVTGDSGCGKSTLFKLLVKQNPYELLHGSIQFNGMPVQSLSKDKLYDEMQYVSQNYFVFEDTLYNNLCMGDEFSKEQIDKAIDICCLNEFVAEYGLDMVMEENGKNISQGQLQRVCIARSLLREPRCLLLDEPTSALDKATGDKLMENIARYTKERGAITFVISHKDDATTLADKSIQLAK